MKHNYIVYHDSCLDGFISGMIAFYKATFFGVQNLVMVPANYSDKPVNVENAESITLVDFSYPMDVLTKYIENGVDVTVVDHHKTFIDSFLEFDKSAQPEIVLNTSYPQPDPEHVLKYHPVHGRRLFTNMTIGSEVGVKQTKLELYLNNNEVGDKNSEFVHSGASLCFHIVTTKDMPPEFKDWMEDQTNGEMEKTVRLARFHDLWLHKGDEMSHAYRLSHWFKKFHKDNRELIDRMKKDLSGSNAFFGALVEKFNSVSLATKLEEARVELETINEKLEALANSDAIQPVYIKHGHHPEGEKVCYVNSPDVRSLGISIVGSYMTRKKGWDVAIMDAVVDDDQHVYSLRSNEEGSDVDVSKICSGFKNDGYALTGGGHTNAAGVAFAKAKKDEFFRIITEPAVEDDSNVQLVTDDPDTALQLIGDVIVVDEDRYIGSYSGYRFTAWINRVPFEASGGDTLCADFWMQNKTIFGGGQTPDDAVSDLINKLDTLMDNPPEGIKAQYTPCRPRFVYYSGFYSGYVAYETDRTVCIDGDPRFERLYPVANALVRKLSDNGMSRLFMN